MSRNGGKGVSLPCIHSCGREGGWLWGGLELQ